MTYKATTDGWLLGSYYAKGDDVALTEEQARVFEREGRIERPTAKKSSKKAD